MVILFLADGFEEIEALTPLDLLRRAGVETVTVGLGGREIRGAHGITVLADTDDGHMPKGPIDMIILPGGMPGASHLDASAVVADTLTRAAQQNAYLAAICAAPMILGKRDVLQGKRAICFPGFEEYLHGATVAAERVVRDGKIVTAAGMGVALDFGLALVAALRGKEAAIALRRAVLAD